MDTRIVGTDKYEDQRNQRIEKMTEIISSIDHWLEQWDKGTISTKVGALIQKYATRELDFISYINDHQVPMDELRSKANDILGGMGQMRIPKPVPALAFSWVHMPYPNFVIKPTRREELEAMTTQEIRDIYFKVQGKELKQERIDHILMSEEADGTE
jgi:hypothetical protein